MTQGIQLSQLLLISGIVVDVDFTDGAAQGRNLHAGSIQPGQNALLKLFNGIICNALAVSGPVIS